MLRGEYVRRKLQLITDDLGYLNGYREIPHADFVDDFVMVATVERLLERIIMRAIDVNRHLIVALKASTDPERTTRLTYRDSFLLLAGVGVYPEEFAREIAPSAGLRNVLVHDYNDADRRLVHASIRRCLEHFPRYVEYVLRFLEGVERREAGSKGSGG